jgi:SAM-dependent methyltransferase
MDTVSRSDSPQREGSPRFWDQWNREWRFGERLDAFMQRQLDIACAVARAERLSNARILGIGCGTGWLENGLQEFGQTWGTDIASSTIEEGRRRYPRVQLLCGEFPDVELSGPFDLVVSADSINPMREHERSLQRVAELLRPGGIFLLMTQNPKIWERRSRHIPVPSCVPHSKPEEWLNLRRIRKLLDRSFVIERETTIEPGGDSGWLWWVENESVRALMGRVAGDYRWQRLLEVAGFGRELIVIARRR